MMSFQIIHGEDPSLQPSILAPQQLVKSSNQFSNNEVPYTGPVVHELELLKWFNKLCESIDNVFDVVCLCMCVYNCF